MNKIAVFISRVFIISSIVFIFIISCDVPLSNPSGIYINKNYSSKICCIETPHEPDTLVLKLDGTFFSGFYGDGKYETINKIGEIEFHLYADKINIYTTVSNKLFQRTEISLNSNTNHHYLKIK